MTRYDCLPRHCDEKHGTYPRFLRDSDKTVEQPYRLDWKLKLEYPKLVWVKVETDEDLGEDAIENDDESRSDGTISDHDEKDYLTDKIA